MKNTSGQSHVFLCPNKTFITLYWPNPTILLAKGRRLGGEVKIRQLITLSPDKRKNTGELNLVHMSDISIRTRSIRKQSMTSPLVLAKIKQEFFFVSSSVRFLAYAWTTILCLRLRRSFYRRLDFFCFTFCFNLMLMFKCEPGIKVRHPCITW